MENTEDLLSPAEQETWRKALVTGHGSRRTRRRLIRLVPSGPRCKICYLPFAGIGGKVLSLTKGFARSRKNPLFCNTCLEAGPRGGLEVEVGVLFADVRGFTAYAEGRPPNEVAQLLNRFYAVATSALSRHDAIIDKLMGDEVMALFLPGFTGEAYLTKMASAAEAIFLGVGQGSKEGPWLPIGIGIDFGLAFVGNVGSGEVKDFTAIGDVINTAARLQREARQGQVVMSERVYAGISDRYPNAQRTKLELKGKREPVQVRIVSIG